MYAYNNPISNTDPTGHRVCEGALNCDGDGTGESQEPSTGPAEGAPSTERKDSPYSQEVVDACRQLKAEMAAIWNNPGYSPGCKIILGEYTGADHAVYARDLTSEAVMVAGVGAMRRLSYVASPKHGPTAIGNISAAPKNGQSALDYSVQVKPTSTRRVGLDYDNGQFVVFDETRAGEFHGHVRAWGDLEPGMRSALIKSGMADVRGRLIVGGQK